MTTPTRPPIRWAGCKRQLLPRIVHVLPNTFHRYWEPFLGSGALYWLLKPDRAVLSDTCGPLIQTYQAIRDNVSAVMRYLRPLVPSKEQFYDVRARNTLGRFKAAAEFLYLNKSCWNGLYRVNAAGVFNVPYGRPKSDNTFDPTNLHACSALLSRSQATLLTQDFDQIASRVRANDFVYFDPPYVTAHNNNGFVDYNETLFSWEDQLRLADLANTLNRLGVSMVVSRDRCNTLREWRR